MKIDYTFDGLLPGRGHRKTTRNIVLHENAGTVHVEKLIKYLKTKGYAYHYVIGRDGTIFRLVSADQKIWHAGQLMNGGSVGICILNGYYPELKAPDTDQKYNNYRITNSEWWTHTRGGRLGYCAPTPAQLDSVYGLVTDLAKFYHIPLIFPTEFLGRKKPKWPRWRTGSRPGDGIIAHGDFSKHADGRYILEDLFKRTSWAREGI